MLDVSPYRSDATVVGVNRGTVSTSTGQGKNFTNVLTDRWFLGDLADFRFETTAGTTWSVVSVFQVNNTAADNRCLMSKWGTGGNQLLWRVSAGTAPVACRLFQGGSFIGDTAAVIELNTPYLACVTSDPARSAGTELQPTVVDLLTGAIVSETQHADSSDTTLTAPIEFGGRQSNVDPMDGAILLTACWKRALTKPEIYSLARDPFGPFRVPRRTVAFAPGAVVSHPYYPVIRRQKQITRLRM